MKQLLLMLLVLTTATITTIAQNEVEDVAGTYEIKHVASNGLIIYTLNLNSDGTFIFHSYEKHDGGIPPERNSYAKGHWTLGKKIVSFTTASMDFDEKFTLDFNNSKARFIIKHPRDKSDKDIKTALQFYESDIFWIQSMKIFKIK